MPVEDVTSDRFLELCQLAKRREIQLSNIEVKMPNSKRRINGLYRVHWRPFHKSLAQPLLFG